MNTVLTVVGLLLKILFGYRVYKDLNKSVYFNGQVSTTDVQNGPEVFKNGTDYIVVGGGGAPTQEDLLRPTLDAVTNEKREVDARNLAKYLMSHKN